MKQFRNLVLTIAAVLAFIALVSYGAGWIAVYQKKTVGVAIQKANREIYEESDSYSRGKRQEIIKAYKEWQETKSIEEKKAIEATLSMSLADFNEDRFIIDSTLLHWVKEVKY